MKAEKAMKKIKFSTILNYAACVVLCVCVVGLVCGAIIYFTQSRNVQQYHIVLTVSPDSIYDGEKFSYYTDSLIQVINRHEHVLEDRYNAILEEKYNTQQYWTIAGILTSIVISILGFFGYKSFKDIETKCVKISKATTSKIVQRQLRSIVKALISDTEYTSYIVKSICDEVEKSTIQGIEERLSALENSCGNSTSFTDDDGMEQDPKMPNLPNSPEEESV